MIIIIIRPGVLGGMARGVVCNQQAVKESWPVMFKLGCTLHNHCSYYCYACAK
jgi:hypothetical protein